MLEAFDSGGFLIESHSIAAVFGSNALDYYGIAASNTAFATVTDTMDNNLAGDFVFIDDFSFIPEPATFVLFALGGLTLLRRRRGA